MKKRLCILFAALFLFFAVSCIKKETADVSKSSGIDRHTEISEVHYPVQYIHTNRISDYPETQYPSITVLSSRAELEKYTGENESNYDFSSSWNSISFYNAVTKYDTAYFEKNSIIMIVLFSPSGSYTHSVDNISLGEGDEYTVNIIRFTHEADTDDVAMWHLFIEVPKESPVLDCDALKISVREKKITK